MNADERRVAANEREEKHIAIGKTKTFNTEEAEEIWSGRE